MLILPYEYHESWNRYWRRRKYRQRIKGGSQGKRKKPHVLRLGGDDAPRQRRWRLRRITKLRWKIISPIKLLAKLQDAYVDMMICLAKKLANSSSNGGFLKGKKVTKSPQASLVVSFGEQVDSRLVMEIYKQLAASRQLSTEDVIGEALLEPISE